MLGQLHNNGVRCSRKRVARLMADQGWVGAHRWSMGERQTTDLVVNVLVMALARRNPDNVVHQSDHGSRYTSLEFSNRMTAWRLKPSFGSVGDCFDNAKIESIWSVIKREIRATVAPREELTRSQLRTALFDYIEIFCHRQRHQAGLGHRTPSETYQQSKKAA
ncbi:MAG: transposase [Acidimicrobiales bacterium]